MVLGVLLQLFGFWFIFLHRSTIHVRTFIVRSPLNIKEALHSLCWNYPLVIIKQHWSNVWHHVVLKYFWTCWKLGQMALIGSFSRHLVFLLNFCGNYCVFIPKILILNTVQVISHDLVRHNVSYQQQNLVNSPQSEKPQMCLFFNCFRVYTAAKVP